MHWDKGRTDLRPVCFTLVSGLVSGGADRQDVEARALGILVRMEIE